MYTRLNDLTQIFRGIGTPRNVLWGILLFSGISSLFYWGIISNDNNIIDSQLSRSGVEVITNNDKSKFTRTKCHGEGRLSGGLPGFYVFDKIWFKSGSFYQPNEIELPPSDSIFTGLNQIEIRPLSESPKFDFTHNKESRIHCYPDETIWDNAGRPRTYNETFDHSIQKRFNWEYHHYHFLAEAILGGIASLDIVRADEPMAWHSGEKVNDNHIHSWPTFEGRDKQRLFIPWEQDWKDGYGLNEPTLQGLFGDRFVDASMWNEITSNDNWVGFDRVVFIDRWAAHKYNPLGNIWNKMALDIFSLLSHHSDVSPEDLSKSSIFNPYRDKFLNHMGIKILNREKPGLALHKIPKIVYVDRQSSGRRLIPEDHVGLLSTLQGLKDKRKAKVVIARLEEMSHKDQIRLFADADIIIGVHGNGLTHQMWMPSGGILIEIFPTGVFLRDYQLVAQVVHHEHIAILDSRIYTREKWESEPGKLLASGPEEERDKNIHLNKEFIKDLLEDKISSLKA